jgi:hypothetical protein
MIAVKCHVCGKELEQPGAILLSPPNKYDSIKKMHICSGCYQGVMMYMVLKGGEDD